MEYRMEYVRGHIEVYSARGEFLFSADTMAEADEMLEESMARCAARGFLFGVLSMAAAVLLGMAAGLPVEAALAKGCVLGFGIAVMVYELSSAYYGFQESRGLEDD